MNPRRNMLRHILIKLTKMKDKEKYYKQQITHKIISVRLSADFSAEILQAEESGMIYFK